MYYGSSSLDRYDDFLDVSATHRLKSAYWCTKQAVIRKLGKPEDKHIVASDSELDAKLELFKSLQITCQDLSTCIEKYLKCIFGLSQAENEMGRFLKQRSIDDKTRAGKMLSAVGKLLSHSAQQRLALQSPLTRLSQEVQTFRNRAIADTLSTIQRTESLRNEYRGALMWMKNISEELDPDMHNKLERFRRVQAQVRKSKATFDVLKLASMQKIDLLAASRCNMLSHTLVGYQDTLLQFWERTARTMVTVANGFKGYQHFEFSLLKHLTQESQKLVEQTSQKSEDELHTPPGSLGNKDAQTEEEIDKQLDFLFAHSDDKETRDIDEMFRSKATSSTFQHDEDAIDLTTEKDEEDILASFFSPHADLTSGKEFDFSGSNTRLSNSNNLFDSLISQDDADTQNSDGPIFSINWESRDLKLSPINEKSMKESNKFDEFGNINIEEVKSIDSTEERMASLRFGTSQATPLQFPYHQQLQPSSNKEINLDPNRTKPTSEMSNWINMFADLSPLGNPDKLSKKNGQVTDI